MKNRLFTTLSLILLSCFLSAQGPQTWSPNKSYTHPALVINGSTTYLSLRDVPSSTSITNTGYWFTLDSMVPKDTPTGSGSLTTPDASEVENLTVPDGNTDNTDDDNKKLLVVGYNNELQKNQIHLMDPDGLNSELLASFDFPSGFWAPDSSLLHGNSLLLKDSSSGWLVFNLKTKQFNKNLELPDLSSDIQKIISVDDTEDLPTPPTYAPGQPPAYDYKETIAGLEEQIEQLMAELNDAKEEISLKDETIAELQSTNQELTYENEELRGELAEEVEKNDVLTAQVSNITQDKNNLKYELGVATKQAEEAVKMAQVPFINGWVYDNDRGWIFTDADHYPLVYTHKTDTWHYFELGSNPRYFFNFKSQQWESWDNISEENDASLANNDNL